MTNYRAALFKKEKLFDSFINISANCSDFLVLVKTLNTTIIFQIFADNLNTESAQQEAKH